MTVLNLQVAAGNDDAEEADDGHGFDAGGTYPDIKSHSSNAYFRVHFAARFANVTIPPGSVIDSAVVSFNVYTASSDDPNLSFYANDVDDANDFATEADVTSRVRTTASVAWNTTAIGTGWRDGPDISAVIQEVVDRAGWASGNALCLLFIGASSGTNRTLRVLSYENGASTAIKLTIDYHVAPVGAAALTLPVPTFSAVGEIPGPEGTATLTLPVPSFDADGYHRQSGGAPLMLPMATLSATGSHGQTGAASLTLPVPVLAAAGAHGVITGAAALTLPVPVLDAAGSHGQTAAAALTLPVPALAAAGAVTVPTGTAALTLPVPVLDADAALGTEGEAALTLPLPVLAAAGAVAVPTGTAALTLPVPVLAAAGGIVSAFTNVRIGAIALYGSALGAARRQAHYDAYVGRTYGPSLAVTPAAIEVAEDGRDVVTSAHVRGTKFLAGQGRELLFEFAENMFTRPTPTSLFLAAGVPWRRRFQMKSAYVSITAPVSGLNYLFTENQDGGGTDETSNVAVSVTDIGGWADVEFVPANDCYVAYFRLYGQSLEWFADQPTAVVSRGVGPVPVGRALLLDVPFAGDSVDLLKYAYQELTIGRYPLDRVTLTVVPLTAAEIAATLGREIGQMVYVDDTDASPAHRSTYTRGAYYVEGVRDMIPAEMVGESWHAQTMLIPAESYRDLDRLVADDFERADAVGGLGISRTGATWVGSTGFDISSEQAIANTNSGQIAYLSLGAGAWHHVVEVALTALTGSVVEAGIAYGVIDASNYYRCYVDRADSLLHLDVVVAGSPTSIATAAWTPAGAAALRVRFAEGRHRIDLDGYAILDETDHTLNTGIGIGLYVSNGVGAVAFDDLVGQGS